MGNKDTRRKVHSRKCKFKGNQYTKKPSKSTAALGEVVNSKHSQQQGPSAQTPKQCVRDIDQASSKEALSASKKKLQLDDYDLHSEEGAASEINEGFILFDRTVLFSLIELVGKCPDCSSRVKLSSKADSRKGFSLLLELECFMCPWEYQIYTSKKIMNYDRQGPKSFEVNARALVAFREIGKGLCLCTLLKSHMIPSIEPYISVDISQTSQKVAAKETK